MALIRLFALALLWGASAAADPAFLADRPLADPRLEAEARALMRDLRCVSCEHQAILDSQAPQAQQMRALVRRELAAGRSPAEVRGWLVERYGQDVSFRPPGGPVGWPLWLAPLMFLGVGAWLAWRAMASR